MDLNIDLSLGRARRGQLEQSLRDAIRVGRIRPGARLPSSRELAETLGVSRGLVVNAYNQLTAEGLLDARAGSGTSVIGGASSAAQVAREALYSPRRFRYDMRPGLPDLAQFPRTAWSGSLVHATRTLATEDLGYANLNGLPVLREVLAQYLDRARATRADPRWLLITSGVSLGLLQACLALQSGGARRVAIEDPGWRWQRSIVERAGLEAVPIRPDFLGPTTQALTRAGVDAVFLTPSHQFPVGSQMPAERREELLRWARATGGYILEDDYDSEYFFGEPRSATVQGSDPDRVILAGTTSKILAPGLRCGWLLVPEQLFVRVSDVREVTLSTVSSVDQAALAHLIATGGLDRHLRRTRRTYTARRAALLDALHGQLPDLAAAARGSGLHIYLPLPDDLDEMAVAGRAQACGAGVYAAGQVSSRTHREPALLLGFARLKTEDASAAIACVADAVRSDEPAPAPEW